MAEADDSTTRFSKRVSDYVRFRPGYPRGVVELLTQETGLSAESIVADIGSGTGLLSAAFLECGYSVAGVEPNREMRAAAENLLARYPRFRSVDAKAEATSLSDRSMDLIVAGQAFHWFDVKQTRREWVRILKPGGVAALIWNERHIESPLMCEVERVIDKFAAAMDPDGAIREGGRRRIQPFFHPSPFRLDEFPNTQEFGLDGLVGRVASCSFVPGLKDPGYAEMETELAEIFGGHQRNGRIRYDYRTKVFWGKLSGGN
jgi:SAM-dependent methyltransferase